MNFCKCGHEEIHHTNFGTGWCLRPKVNLTGNPNADAGDCPCDKFEAAPESTVLTTLKIYNDMLATLETLLGGLEEGQDIGSLLTYINIQVRAVVQMAGGKVPPPADCSPYLKKVAAVDQLIEALTGVLKSHDDWEKSMAGVRFDDPLSDSIQAGREALQNAGVQS
jgi:hypothetical protein